MATCEVCGNEYDKTFEVRRGHALAPVCEHCGCRVIGHGVEADERIFCCANCAERAGVTGLADRA